jgi:amine acid ABC transporter, permease protein, 3-TM region, His/Glu/Gln/Arg/opine family
LLDLQGYGWLLLKGLQMTVLVGLCAMFMAILFGLLGAWGKFSHSRLANWAADTYTTVVRGVPELILLLLVYYGVPKLIQDGAAALGYELRLDLNPFVAGFMTIGFIYGAFCTEVLRGVVFIRAAWADGGSASDWHEQNAGVPAGAIATGDAYGVAGIGQCVDGIDQSHRADFLDSVG